MVVPCRLETSVEPRPSRDRRETHQRGCSPLFKSPARCFMRSRHTRMEGSIRVDNLACMSQKTQTAARARQLWEFSCLTYGRKFLRVPLVHVRNLGDPSIQPLTHLTLPHPTCCSCEARKTPISPSPVSAPSLAPDLPEPKPPPLKGALGIAFVTGSSRSRPTAEKNPRSRSTFSCLGSFGSMSAPLGKRRRKSSSRAKSGMSLLPRKRGGGGGGRASRGYSDSSDDSNCLPSIVDSVLHNQTSDTSFSRACCPCKTSIVHRFYTGLEPCRLTWSR